MSHTHTHPPPIEKKLYWPTVKSREEFKIGLIKYKNLKHGQSAYLGELIHSYTSSRITRHSSSKLNKLHIPTFAYREHKSHKQFYNSSCHYVPALWNCFPFQIRNSPSVTSVRKYLKTHIFNSCFLT